MTSWIVALAWFLAGVVVGGGFVLFISTGIFVTLLELQWRQLEQVRKDVEAALVERGLPPTAVNLLRATLTNLESRRKLKL